MADTTSDPLVALEQREVVRADLVDALVARIRVEHEELKLRVLATHEHAVDLEKRLLASERADAIAHSDLEELVETRRADMRAARQRAERTASELVAAARAEADAIRKDASRSSTG